MPHTHRVAGKNDGFTLLEILVALAVVSVGMAIFVSMFTASLNLARTSQRESVAIALAQEQLNDIIAHPTRYVWPKDMPIGQQFDIPPTQGDATCTPPSVLPIATEAAKRETRFYTGFHWQAYGKCIDKDAGYLEIALAIRWKDTSKENIVTLTGTIPRPLVPGGATQ